MDKVLCEFKEVVKNEESWGTRLTLRKFNELDLDSILFLDYCFYGGMGDEGSSHIAVKEGDILHHYRAGITVSNKLMKILYQKSDIKNVRLPYQHIVFHKASNVYESCMVTTENCIYTGVDTRLSLKLVIGGNVYDLYGISHLPTLEAFNEYLIMTK